MPKQSTRVGKPRLLAHCIQLLGEFGLLCLPSYFKLTQPKLTTHPATHPAQLESD